MVGQKTEDPVTHTTDGKAKDRGPNNADNAW
jgi:hypothetical protein